MPSNRRQHFVPRFYLRRFSTNGKSINIWNIKREGAICNANLKNQCSGDYFYGKNLNVELALSTIEGRVAQILHSIEKTKCLPSPGSVEQRHLVLYVLMQHGRTLHAADELNEMTDNLTKQLLRGSNTVDGDDFEDVKIGLKEPARTALSSATSCYPLLFGLAYKILVNTTPMQFVTSDNPVVLYNQPCLSG